jgi:hypothetical protein
MLQDYTKLPDPEVDSTTFCPNSGKHSHRDMAPHATISESSAITL